MRSRRRSHAVTMHTDQPSRHESAPGTSTHARRPQQCQRDDRAVPRRMDGDPDSGSAEVDAGRATAASAVEVLGDPVVVALRTGRRRDRLQRVAAPPNSRQPRATIIASAANMGATVFDRHAGHRLVTHRRARSASTSSAGESSEQLLRVHAAEHGPADEPGCRTVTEGHEHRQRLVEVRCERRRGGRRHRGRRARRPRSHERAPWCRRTGRVSREVHARMLGDVATRTSGPTLGDQRSGRVEERRHHLMRTGRSGPSGFTARLSRSTRDRTVCSMTG